MAAVAPANLKVETEGDLQVLYFTLASVANNDTTDISKFFKTVRGIDARPSTSAAIGATHSAGTITWLVSAGTPNLIVRVAGGA